MKKRASDAMVKRGDISKRVGVEQIRMRGVEVEQLVEKDRGAGFLLLCTARPQSDLVVRTHQRVAKRDHRLARGLPTPRA